MSGVIVRAEKIQCHIFDGVNFVVCVECVVVVIHIIVCEYDNFFAFFVCFFLLC